MNRVCDKLIYQSVDTLKSKKDSEHLALHRALKDIIVDLPYFYMKSYEVIGIYEGRLSCVYYSQSYSRLFFSATQLAMKGIFDKSRVVRYRSFRLLALTQNKSLLKFCSDAKCRMKTPDDMEDLEFLKKSLEYGDMNKFLNRGNDDRITIRIKMKLKSSHDMRQIFGNKWEKLCAEQRIIIDEIFGIWNNQRA